MELLQSFGRMQKMIVEKGWNNTRILKEDEVFRYKEHEFKISKNCNVYNCPAEEVAKILYMYKRIDKAYRGGLITLRQIENAVEEAYKEVQNENKEV